MLCCHIKPWAVMVEIVSVCHCSLMNLTQEEVNASGYESDHQMVEDLRRYYPNLDGLSNVTVIQWKNPQGKLVKDHLTHEARKGRR